MGVSEQCEGGEVTRPETDPAQLELEFPGLTLFRIGDLVMFPSSSNKWNHVRQVVGVDSATMTLQTKPIPGALQVGPDIMSVPIKRVLGRWGTVDSDT